VTAAFAALAVAMLLMTQCTAFQETSNVRDMADNPPSEKPHAAVAIWVKPGVDPRDVLERYGVERSDIRMLAEDKAVGEVDQATLKQTVRRLQGDPEVREAGFITVQENQDGSVSVPPVSRKAPVSAP